MPSHIHLRTPVFFSYPLLPSPRCFKNSILPRSEREISSEDGYLFELQGHTLLARIDGADVERLRAEVAKHSRKTPQALSHTDQAPAAPAVAEDTPTETGEELEKRLKGLMEMDKVVLFMKGSPDVPRCGFSRQIVGLLKEQNIQFSHFDILSDESVRSGEYFFYFLRLIS